MAPKTDDEFRAGVHDARLADLDRRMGVFEENQRVIFAKLSRISQQISWWQGVAVVIGFLLGVLLKGEIVRFTMSKEISHETHSAVCPDDSGLLAVDAGP